LAILASPDLRWIAKIATLQVTRLMPTSIGHALAGAAAAWSVDLVPGRRAWRTAPPAASWYRRAGNGLTLVCVALAAVPDADLLFRLHRTFSHSIGAVILVGVVAAAIAALTKRPVVRVASMCAVAYGTHLLLDWLAVDLMPPYGIQAFWPFSDAWYISPWIVFRQIERTQLFSAATLRLNALAVAQELVVLAPILIVIWLVRVKALARLAAEMSRGHHPAE
jgi:membrane-bound metal-dependent hydrolase YbcI (DUF457 family)